MPVSVPDILARQDAALDRWDAATPRSATSSVAILAGPPPEPAPPLKAELSGTASGEADPAARPLGDLVEAGHFANYTIWALEDEARRRDVGDTRIAAVKRAIDPWNQRRNDLMEAIDAAIFVQFANVNVQDAELHSETAGMIIDRLSILALKIHSMERIAVDATTQLDTALAAECASMALVLRRQRDDLAGCLVRLLDDFAAGRRCFRSYRQMKMYNDERLNPALRAPTARSAGKQT